jgi:acyl dehydratase
LRVNFSDFTPRQVIETGSYSVSEPEICEFAERYDPQWFHIDRDRAQTSRWGGLIASGWHTCAIAMRLVVEAVLAGSSSIGSPGIENLRWLSPLRPGMRVGVRIEVLECRKSSSGRSGIVRWRWRMISDSGVEVLDLIATSLFELKQSPHESL